MLGQKRRIIRVNITAQFVCYDDTRVTKTVKQSLKETPCSLRISLRLNKDIQNVSIGIDCPPQPEFSSSDRNHVLIEMPFVVDGGPIPLHACGEVRSEPVHPFANGFATDHYTPLCQKILDIRGAERKPVVGPDSIRNDFTWVAEALQARHFGWYLYASRLCKPSCTFKLAMPIHHIGFQPQRQRGEG